MMLRCAIVDDEPLALSLLESYVNKTPFLQLAGKYSSAVQAMKELPGEEVDLLFLKRLTTLADYEKISAPIKKHGKYYFSKNDGLQNQSAFYVQDSLDGEPRVFLDPK